ncbi:MAG: SLC13 family permease [Planctomycetota bacterium]
MSAAGPLRAGQDSERGSARSRGLGLTLGPLLFAALMLLPGLPLDRPQRAAAAVTALTACLWTTLALPLAVTALLPAVLFPLLGVLSSKEIAPCYMHELVLLFLGAFMIALGLERWGVQRRIALGIVLRIGSSPRALCLGFMVAAAFLSMWISNTATTLLLLPIALAAVAAVGGEGEATDPSLADFAPCLLLGVAYSASIGGTATLVGTAPNLAFLSIWNDGFGERYGAIDFGSWMLAWLPLTLLFVPAAWLLLTRVLFRVPKRAPGEGETRELLERQRAQLGPWRREELWMVGVFALTALLWTTRRDLDFGFVQIPGWSRWLADPASVGDSTVALALATLLFLLPARERSAPGERGERTWLLTWRTAERLPWEVLLLFGGGFAIAKAFEVTGLAAVLGEGLSPWLEGRATWIVVLATALFLSFLTEVTSNTATTFVLLPIAAEGARAAGIHPLVVMMPATIAASLAFMLPVATPPNAVVTASRLVPPPLMARVGFKLNLLGVALVTIVFHFWVGPRLLG